MSTAASTKRIIVCGGNGFVGSRICKYAVARGWDVTSISRSGEPQWNTVTASSQPPPWARKVAWEQADLLRPSTYASLLKGADYVVHSMGILLEADYKGVLTGRESPISGLQKAFSGVQRPSRNPLERGEMESYARADSSNDGPTNGVDKEMKDQLTYETMNRDSAILLAREAANSGASAFAYMSAAGGAPVLPVRYIESKRAAESTICSEFPRMRGVFIRAPFMYDSSRPVTMPMAAMTGAGALFNRFTGGILGGMLGAAGVKPLKVEVVAEAVVEALGDEKTNGPVEVGEIEELAEKAWRRTML